MIKVVDFFLLPDTPKFIIILTKQQFANANFLFELNSGVTLRCSR